jgi:uroporphyrinogen decarboxylase
MHYQPVDHIPDIEFGYWEEVYRLWHQQGMPSWVTNEDEANRFFGFETREILPVWMGVCPPFESKVIEESETRQVFQDSEGVLYERRKDGASCIPHFLEFPVKTRQDWKEFKKRLDPATPGRMPAGDDWEKYKEKLNSSDLPVRLNLGSLFGKIRDWMGFERVAITCADDPAWIHEMVETLCEFSCVMVEKVLKDVKVDYAYFWEDMAFNHGPIISPKMFREFLVPRYKRITEICRRRGLDFIYVDCDGNIMEIAGLWLEAGVNCMFPLDVNGRTDAFELRKRFGREMLLMGGVDKKALIKGGKAIDEELERIAPLVEAGGYIPHVDHLVPADVTYENYLCYIKRKREIFGIPARP